MEIIISSFLEELKALKEENKGLKDLNEKQSINIIDLQKVVEQQVLDRMCILEQKNQIQEQFETYKVEESSAMQELKETLEKSDEQRRNVELQLFKIKMEMESSKNSS